MYSFIEVHADRYPLKWKCQILKISRSAYYSWIKKKCAGWDASEKKKEMEQSVISIFKEHRRRYGVQQPFPVKPNEVWVGDITYIALSGGSFLYLAVWMGLFSRKIIGWQLKDHMKEALIIEAFKKAQFQHTS